MVVVCEMTDMVPRRKPALPNLWVATVNQPEGNLQAAFEKLKKRRKQLGPYLVKPLSLSPIGSFESPTEAKAKAKVLKYDLARRGYTVNPNPGATFSIYVVHLDGEKLKRPGQKCVYVGETAIDVDQRLAQHSEGKRLAARVSKAFMKRAVELEPEFSKIFSRYDSVAAEIEWKEHLESMGYVVWGGSEIRS